MYSIKISHPKLTKAGKIARRSSYSVAVVSGSSARTMTMGQFCTEQDIGYVAMLNQVRGWQEGFYSDEFVHLVLTMRANVKGSYGKQGRMLVCPSCGADVHKRKAIFAARRKARDASPLNSAIRQRAPEFFGETAALAEAPATEAPSSL